MSLNYWFMFPIAVVVAAVANGAGIGGATFFSPLFILALGLEPEVAIGTALITEIFGFTSGVNHPLDTKRFRYVPPRITARRRRDAKRVARWQD